MAVTGNPGQANYAASKSAMIAMYKSLALEVGQRNIRVNIIAPGFIKTPMTAELKGMPFLMPVETAVEKIANAIDRGKKTFVFPWQMKIMINLLKILPDGVIKKFGSK